MFLDKNISKTLILRSQKPKTWIFNKLYLNFQLLFFIIIINIYLKHNASHDFF
jgi:hypothetical protein